MLGESLVPSTYVLKSKQEQDRSGSYSQKQFVGMSHTLEMILEECRQQFALRSNISAGSKL